MRVVAKGELAASEAEEELEAARYETDSISMEDIDGIDALSRLISRGRMVVLTLAVLLRLCRATTRAGVLRRADLANIVLWLTAPLISESVNR